MDTTEMRTQKKLSIYNPVMRRLDELVSGYRGHSQLINHLLDRHFALMDMHQVEGFGEPEWMIAIDAFNGHLQVDNQKFEMAEIGTVLAEACELDALHMKWKVDKDKFVDKLYRLSMLDQAKILHVIEFFWSNNTHEKFKTYRELLQAAGVEL